MTQRRLLPLLAPIVLFFEPDARAEHFITPDGPTALGGVVWESHEMVRDDASTFTLEGALPPGTSVDATHRLGNGDWLFSVAEPTRLGGVFYDPRDVIRYDGSGFSLFQGGAAAGIPPVANVDALFLMGGDAGDLVLSLDVPARLGAVAYQAADLVRYSAGAFSAAFDASAVDPPIPPTTNVVEADERGGRLYLSFDVPTRLGAITYLPGQVVEWNGSTYRARFTTSGWPAGSVMTGLALGSCRDADGDDFGETGDPGCAGGPGADCNDADAGAIAMPATVDGLAVSAVAGGFGCSWDDQAATAGDGIAYDLFWGSLGMMSPPGAFDTGICGGEDLPAPMAAIPPIDPAVGDAYYYMVRAQNSCGTSSWGTTNRDVTAAASITPCD